MDLRPYEGKEGEGLKGREYLAKRETTVQRVFDAVMVSAAQLVKLQASGDSIVQDFGHSPC